MSVGVKGGGRLTGALDPDADNRDESRQYTVGPMVELHLPLRLSVEVDALYRRMGDRGGDCVFTFCGFSRRRANSWEFPMLVKRRYSLPGAQFYGGVGYTPRRVGKGAVDNEQYRTGPLVPGEVVDTTIHRFVTTSPAETTHGVTAVAGIELPVLKVKLAPEFRYTHWNRRFWEEFGSRGFFTGSNQNQFELLLGISR